MIAAQIILCNTIAVFGDAQLRNATIKPIQNEVIASSPDMTTGDVGELRLFIFSHPLTSAERAYLQGKGIYPLRYVPDNAWLCRIGEPSVTSASDEATLPSILGNKSYQPAYRIYEKLTSETNWNLSAIPKKIRVVLTEDTPTQEIESIAKDIHSSVVPKTLRGGIFLGGTATGAVLEKLSQNNYVLWIESVANLKPTGEVAAKIVEGDNTEHIPFVQALGYDGTGVVTAVADTGLDTGDLETLHKDLQGHVQALYYYGDVDSAGDEYGHGTHVSGSIIANGLRGYGTVNEDDYLYGLGTAPGAQLVAQRIIDSTGTLFLTEDFQLLARDAYREGVSVVNNSWGAEESGRYDSYAAEYDALVRDSDNLTEGDQEIAYVFAAGNSGPGTQTVITPGVGKNVITVGASQSARQVLYIYEDGIDAMADFSSRGPTEDGRYKPDIVAPGTWISSTKSSLAPEGNEWLEIDNNYTYMGGTSMASPITTGATATLIQYFRTACNGASPSPALLKALLIASAQDMDDTYGTDATPNYDEGWGRISLPDIIENETIYLCENQSVLLEQGEEWERKVFVKNGDEIFRVTLAYTDVPGLPSSIPALVNDLDLVVTAPDGSVYYGNQLSNGSSVTGSSPDRINNVEGILLTNPLPGAYSVHVQAYRIAEDARIDTSEIDQDFALVIAGNLVIDSDQNLVCLPGTESVPLPSQGLLFTDRSFYTAPDTICVNLYDPDLATTDSPTVTIFSDSLPDGLTLTLSSIGDSGFSGSIQTVNAESEASVTDDVLPILNDETITVTYADANPEGTVITTAKADLITPVIHTPEAKFAYGKITIQLETDTLAKVTLHYGQGNELSKTIQLETYDTEHALTLSGLAEGEYLYWIEAVDYAGNVSTNNNSGSYFTFTVEKSATILLVDAVTDNQNSFDVTPPPLSGYTEPLDQLGYDYEIWSASELGSLPVLEDLIAYNVVIWRVDDLAYLDLVTTLIIPAENMTAIEDYVQQGGAFFLSSMEILSYGTDSFMKNVLHVESFTEDTEVASISGISGDPIGNGIVAELDYSAFPRLESFFELGPDLSDSFVPTTDATASFYGEDGAVAAHYPISTSSEDTGSGRTVFFSFPIDSIPMEGEEGSTRSDVFQRVLQFLSPGLNGYGNLSFENAAYSVPSLAVIELADTDLIGAEYIPITVSSDKDSTPVSVPLYPTIYSSVFRGYISIRDSESTAATDNDIFLRAENGDIITATYYDESTGKTDTITVPIDTIAPIISNTTIELDYMDGVVQWETDEESDSLIEYGETVSLGHTVYDASYQTTHTATITGLIPDRAYYFRVSSRDAAKNTATDDNEGALYMFRTPTPLTTPWADDFEKSSSLWLVMNDDSAQDWGTQSSWEWGTPSSSIQDIVPGAYSGTNCYGVNLNGDYNEISITALFSPAIYLDADASEATLSFMTVYDMISQDDNTILNAGSLSISTNNGVDWTTLRSYTDESTYGEWKEEIIDLSKWIGQTVRFQWYYNFMTIWSDQQKPGWYIDDVSVVTSTQIDTGLLRISSNISAGNWQLSSDVLNLSAGGLIWTTNVPTGYEYTITWEDVPWLITPKAEAKMFNQGQKSLSFEGIYTFTDTNGNNISDEWEEYFFETLFENGGEFQDADGDGLSNKAEFLAGTDPLNAKSNLQLSATLDGTSTLLIHWQGVKGKTYQVQTSIDLKNWTSFGDPIRPEADGENRYALSIETTEQIACRIEVIP